jgi:hypothetical protein
MASLRFHIEGQQSDERAVLSDEDVSLMLEEIDAVITSRAAAGRRSRRDEVYTTRPSMPRVRLLLRDRMRQALEDEIIPASDTTDDGNIQPTDLDREVMKKALAGLKAEGLRRVARKLDTTTSGTVEELATRVAQQYRWHDDEIARLILEHEPEPTESRSFVSRIFPLAEAPEMEKVKKRLSFVANRYIRVGIARWFVFDDVVAADTQVVVKGRYRTYNAEIRGGVDAEVSAVPAGERQIEATLDGDRVLIIDNANTAAAAASKKALTEVAPISFAGNVRGLNIENARDVAPHTLLLLELITTAFQKAGLIERNPTIARFRVNDSASMRKPSLLAVRFEGEHLLDNRTACRLAGPEGRSMNEVAMTVRFNSSDPSDYSRFPMRISLHDDHIALATGLGTTPSLSHNAHRRAVDAIVQTLLVGSADERALINLVDRIFALASSSVDAEEPTMMGDDYDAAVD